MTQQSLQLKIQNIINIHLSGNTHEAINEIKSLIKLNPHEAIPLNVCGVLYKEIQQHDEAISYLKQSLSLKADYPEAYFNLGLTYQEINEINSAIDCYKLAIKINPKYSEAYNNLGNLLKNNDKPKESIVCFKEAIEIEPNFVSAWNNLGNAFSDLGQLSDAVDCYKKALKINVNIPEIHNNLGNVLKDMGSYEKAIKCYKKSLEIYPENYETYNNLGAVLDKLGDSNDAIKAYEKAIEINPDFAEGYFNRGQVLNSLQNLPEALASFELAYRLEPGIDFIFGDLLHLKMYLCIWDDFDIQLNELKNKITEGYKVVNPFPMLALIDDLELQKKVSEIYINKGYALNSSEKLVPYRNHEKIRIGYFSPDFRDHAVSYLSSGMFELHDRDQFEIYAFYYGEDTNDEMNQRIRNGVDKFFDIQSMSDHEVIKLSRAIEIDIAIDLCGYTQNSRINLFARRVAPIQLNYLGYTGTSGADYMDYIVCDDIVISDKTKYSEKIIFMPNSYMVNDILDYNYKRDFTREEVGLPSNGFVFCCFNNHYKILPSVFASWMRILVEVEGSVLWLAETNEYTTKNLLNEAKKFSIQENRIIFAPQMSLRHDHLNRIKLADLFLDTSPFNAHTTASDALRMGIPILTKIGDSFVSRVAASLLNALNLSELVVNTQEEYELLAINIATDPNEIQMIKNKLENNLKSESLFDTNLYTKNLEAAFRKIYELSISGIEPIDLKIDG